MGFLNPTSPPVDPQEFLQRPFLDRMRYLATFWADHGFGTPRVIHVVYILKLVDLLRLRRRPRRLAHLARRVGLRLHVVVEGDRSSTRS